MRAERDYPDSAMTPDRVEREISVTRRTRERMVENQLVARGIKDNRVLTSMGLIPRHLFVDEALRARAYGDHPLPIGEGQTISQPYMVALMTEALCPGEKDRVLEIGTGSGYQTAVLKEMTPLGRVYTIERLTGISKRARKRLTMLGYNNILYRVSDGTLGWPEFAPFDRIIVTAGAPAKPSFLLKQLAPGGCLVAPVGGTEEQLLRRCVATDSGFLDEEIETCRFVRLIGKDGWEE